MPVARLRRSMRGMTLVEILVVVLIIGILAALATLSIGLLGDDREIEDENRRLADAIALLQEQAQLEGRDFGILLETALKPDFAFIRAQKADEMGNLVNLGSSLNFTPTMAAAGRVTIAEVDEIVA